MRQVHTATRNEIASMTGLSVATSGNILKEMLSRNEVSEYRLEEPNGGRPAHRYEYIRTIFRWRAWGSFTKHPLNPSGTPLSIPSAKQSERSLQHVKPSPMTLFRMFYKSILAQYLP